jgi:hypothetical protein
LPAARVGVSSIATIFSKVDLPQPDGPGEGLMLRKGVRDILLRREKNRFMKEEWPVLRSRLKRLGIDFRLLAETFND